MKFNKETSELLIPPIYSTESAGSSISDATQLSGPFSRGPYAAVYRVSNSGINHGLILPPSAELTAGQSLIFLNVGSGYDNDVNVFPAGSDTINAGAASNYVYYVGGQITYLGDGDWAGFGYGWD